MLLCVILIHPIHSLLSLGELTANLSFVFLLPPSFCLFSRLIAFSHLFTSTFVLCVLIYVQTNSILIHSFCIYFQLAAKQFMECIWRVSIENVIWNIYIWITGKSNGFFSLKQLQKISANESKKKRIWYVQRWKTIGI